MPAGRYRIQGMVDPKVGKACKSRESRSLERGINPSNMRGTSFEGYLESGMPLLAAGVPADEHVRGDQCGHALEELEVVDGGGELADPLALVDDRDGRALDRRAGARPAGELAFLDEADRCVGDAPVVHRSQHL